MIRSSLRSSFLLLGAALLTGSFCVPACAQNGPALSARFGVAGRYKPGGWCLAAVTVRNAGPDPVDGQLQVQTADNAQSGPRRFGRAPAPAAQFAVPVSIPGGSQPPQTYTVYLHGMDPSRTDFTVRLAEGRERGDGRVLAEISSQNPSQAAAFSGSPVGPDDRLLIGFGGDPGAFLFLNGRQLSAVNSPNTGRPAALQVAEAAAAADLPDKAAGYGGADAVLLRSDAPLDGLTEAQVSALKGWVAGGGHLIVCGGSDPTRLGAAFFEGLLPAAVGGAGAGGALTLIPKPLPGIVSLPSAHSPQIVSGPFGAGRVTVTAADPTLAPAQMAGTAALPPVWKTLLAGPPASSGSVLRLAAAHAEMLSNAYYYSGSQPSLSEAVLRGPSLDAPGPVVIGAFLLAYLVVLVPVNYLVLKRLDRKEWAWGTIPALVLLFAAGTFAVGYAAKGGTVFVNRAAIVETAAGRREAGTDAALGLFSPHRTSYDITLTGTDLSAAPPNPSGGYGRPDSDAALSAGIVQLVQTPAGISLPNTPVNMWAMRAFDVQSTTDLGGAFDAKLTVLGGSPAGTLVNHTPFSLSGCAIYSGGRWHDVGTLAAGATLTLDGNAAGRPSFPVPRSPAGTPSGIGDRMQAALSGYFASLGQSGYTDDGSATVPGFAPAPGEALLAGWSRDPHLAGPQPRIDGRTVTENDVSLVIVHLPVGEK